ncbi:MAG TPA: PIN domain-containing protein [Terriglobales bacterium]|nr:PIN domain-containing protein [Terriglobales bacterium]
MRYFFDTSVLVPAFLDEHVHHEASRVAYLKADKRYDCCAAHSLAEVYSTLTRLPGNQRATTDQAMLFLENMSEKLTFIALNADEYWSAIAAAAESGVCGGMTYDALLARCALKARAETIYTWNLEHFQRLGPKVAKLVRTP